MNKTFEQIIYHKWTNSFGCPTETAYQAGTTIVPESKYEGKKVIVLEHIGRHTFAQIDPFYFQTLNQLVQTLPPQTSMNGTHIQTTWDEQTIQSHDHGLTYYLHASDLPPHLPPGSFNVRKLELGDADQMSGLHQACTPEEVEEGYVEVTHQITFGCFQYEELVAASSGYERTGFLDIGVLTHPNFRKKGLGRAVVGALCVWAIEKHIIPQYRHNALNINSQRIAESLNFKPYFKTEAFTFR
jgi:predicted GNAT family acetyltransferase